jgi:hypothetical protein
MKTGKWLAIIVVPAIIGVCVFSAFGTGRAYSAQIVPEAKNAILNATVQIYMFSLIRNDGSSNTGDARLTLGEAQQGLDAKHGYYMGHGVGTLVATDQGTLIVTHDHWGEVLEIADLVEVRDAKGCTLQTTTGLEFRMSILYRDMGTMVLIAPAGVNLVPARLGDSSLVSLHTKALITRQNPDGSGSLEVIAAEIKSTENFKGQEAWRLDTLDGEVLVPGDSGGGVWLDGKLVGNLWARRMKSKLSLDFTQPQEEGTRTVYAAQNPAQIQPALAKALENDAAEISPDANIQEIGMQ